MRERTGGIRERDWKMRIPPNMWRISARTLQALSENVRRGTLPSSFYEVSFILLPKSNKDCTKDKTVDLYEYRCINP